LTGKQDKVKSDPASKNQYKNTNTINSVQGHRNEASSPNKKKKKKKKNDVGVFGLVKN